MGCWASSKLARDGDETSETLENRSGSLRPCFWYPTRTKSHRLNSRRPWRYDEDVFSWTVAFFHACFSTQIIFVSSDSDADEFNEYFEEMPWTAVPYDSDEVRF